MAECREDKDVLQKTLNYHRRNSIVPAEPEVKVNENGVEERMVGFF